MIFTIKTFRLKSCGEEKDFKNYRETVDVFLSYR